jgi:hypothetical protein
MKLVLEQRYLFDGSAAAVGHHALSAEHHHNADSVYTDRYDHASGHSSGNHDIAVPAAFDQVTPRRPGSGETILFVDQQVTDWQALVAGVKPGVDVVVLNPGQDGITQVTQALAGLSNVKAIEFLTDGTPGAITLGSTTLDAATLTARASEITGWSSHLAANADVVFWGCDVGLGSAGQAFVADVHTLTGATVGASSDATGAAALGGDWTLEVTTGPLQRNINPFTRDSGILYGRSRLTRSDRHAQPQPEHCDDHSRDGAVGRQADRHGHLLQHGLERYRLRSLCGAIRSRRPDAEWHTHL